MKKPRLSYSKVIKIEEQATHKLMTYIQNYVSTQKFDYSSIQFPFMGNNQKERIMAFNVWLSLDYTMDNNKNFIKLFLDDVGNKLTINERNILKERNKTHISLYEISEIKGKNLVLTDLFTGKEYTVYEPRLADIDIYNSILLGRIGNVLGYYKFIGIVHLIYDNFKEYLVNTILYDYECEQEINPYINSLNEYLRKYSNRVYYFYQQIIEVESEEEYPLLMSSKAETQLSMFAQYLKDKNLNAKTIDKHIDNLISFYFYYLSNSIFTFNQITHDMINDFLMNAILDKYINSKTEVSSLITTFNKYAKYLNEAGQIDKEDYNEIKGISKNKDEYFRKFDYLEGVIEGQYSIEEWFNDDIEEKELEIDLKYDSILKDIVKSFDTVGNVPLIDDFETYLEYISNNSVKVTKVKKYISRKHLIEINELMKNRIHITNSVNQDNIPLLHLFYMFGIDNKLFNVDEKDYISINKKMVNKYYRLKTSEKIALFIDYIWNKCNWGYFDINNWSGYEKEYKNRYSYAKTLGKLNVGQSYSYSKVLEMHETDNYEKLQENFSDLLSYVTNRTMRYAFVFNSCIIKFFSYLNLICMTINKNASNFDKKYGNDILKVEINELGQKVFRYLSGGEVKKKRNNDKGKVIHLFN